MSYTDNLKECTYTSPSGKSFTLQFDELERDGAKKLSISEPPQQDRAEVQDMGNSGIRLPLTVYISGDDFKEVSDAFFAALSERYSRDAPAVLGHPRWGDILVCPATWTQVEGWVENMGQAVFTIEFIRIDRDASFPLTTNDAGGQLQADADAAAFSSKSTYGDKGVPQNPAETAKVGGNTTNLLTQTGSALGKLAASAQDLGAQFSADLTTALSSVDSLVADPLALASSVLALVRAPAVAALEINDKINAYKAICTGMVSLTTDSFAECELMFLGAGAVAVGASEATLSPDPTSRGAAVDASDNIDAILEQLRALRDAAELTGWVCDGDSWANIEDLLSSARSRLLAASFDLKSQRSKPMPSAMDPNSAVKLLYGTWSDALVTQFGMDNDLQDDEWFVIPAGRMVVWYA